MSIGFCRLFFIHQVIRSWFFFSLLVVDYIDFHMLNQPCKPRISSTIKHVIFLYVVGFDLLTFCWGFCVYERLVCIFPVLWCLKKFIDINPGWCGSVDWVPACEPNSHWFDSQSGHISGFPARSPVGGMREATDDPCLSLISMFLSLFFSLHSPLSKNK